MIIRRLCSRAVLVFVCVILTVMCTVPDRYMAPEMVIMLSQASYEKTGYTCAVDWWSLGVTMFKLLTGALQVHACVWCFCPPSSWLL
jgi:serine/threonine protein kinase